MRLAARRGVKVTIAIPQRSNHLLADFVRSRPMRDLAAAGVEFRLLSQMVHAKAVVIDETLAMCGSINLDLRSLLLNHEAAVVFYGTRADRVARGVDLRRRRGRATPIAPSRPACYAISPKACCLLLPFSCSRAGFERQLQSHHLGGAHQVDQARQLQVSSSFLARSDLMVRSQAPTSTATCLLSLPSATPANTARSRGVNVLYRSSRSRTSQRAA